MSRVGKIPVLVPQGVKANISAGKITVEGIKGALDVEIPEGVKIVPSEGRLLVETTERNMQGLVRAMVTNAVKGVSEGWSKTLELSGTGFRAVVSGKNLQLNLGFSHPVNLTSPEGIEFMVKENKITVSGVNRMLVGQMAATIRRLKPADVYKAKGFKYEGETILRKPGKAAKAGGTAK